MLRGRLRNRDQSGAVNNGFSAIANFGGPHCRGSVTVDPACRAGFSSNALTAPECTLIQSRRFAPALANVAVSLRRDEPCSAPLRSIWPVNPRAAFTCCSLHGLLQAKDQRLISAERDGYIKTETHSTSTCLRNTNIVADWLRLFADTSSKTAAKDELSHPIDHHADRSQSVSLQSLSR